MPPSAAQAEAITLHYSEYNSRNKEDNVWLYLNPHTGGLGSPLCGTEGRWTGIDS